jgi:hypothetical protein
LRGGSKRGAYIACGGACTPSAIRCSGATGDGWRPCCPGIAVTSAARTVLDLAASIPDERALQRVLDHAEVLRLTDGPRLVAVAEAHPGHHGAGRLRRALAEHTPGTTLTRSDLEERMLALCRNRGLPQPRVNHFVAGLEVDFLFAEQRLVVEADGWAFHSVAAAITAALSAPAPPA